MKFQLKLFLFIACLGGASVSYAQVPETIKTESSEPGETPLDDVVERTINVEKRVLKYDNPREVDLMWEKRVWRVIDLREKMNFPFTYPEETFAGILLNGAKEGKIRVYSTKDDKFTDPLTAANLESKLVKIDTIPTVDPETYEETIQIVKNEINENDFKRIRVKEMWYFDSETSTMKVRILGLAAIRDVFDDNGNFKYEEPMFWIYYPHIREELAKHRVFMEGNDASPLTWEDFMEMRFFSSYVYKESNVKDNRLSDYLSGVDLLMEGERIKADIFNWEHDLWQY
ncbi:MAG TPA: gliding motility protein GldN [Saprospiraceae bacterium]|nr:gliding motility protein GldN [Saprospiraceae bacterium]MCC6688484.1 gliding motility protein GldN [Saprospiraceae bacterium]HMV23396.1 gliding motility protein GldN [Saprospiraceae bacterium]HMW74346.1 gliding motility protein GldN [Saprospiraceae bacterium]HMX82279.1 gliding motility protein GldN [Saprospiraceae bacterium]